VRLSYAGKELEYDASKLPLPEAREIKRRSGLNPPQWREALIAQDSDAEFLLWVVACMRNGEPFDYEADAKTFDVNALQYVPEPDTVTEDADSDLPTGPGQGPGSL
jgi:hypothetical protein